MNVKEAPAKLKLYVSLGFDYHESRTSEQEAHADCLFCGAKEKLYINYENGLWNCKAGACQLAGNSYSFMKLWYDMYHKESRLKKNDSKWETLSKDRSLSPENLRQQDIVHDGIQWYIAVRNAKGSIVNLRRYQKGKGLQGLPEVTASIFGAELLADSDHMSKPIYICEGEWDAIAMRIFLGRESSDGIAIGLPGAGIWRDAWSDQLIGRSVILCYDNDQAGAKGTKRLWQKLKDKVSNLVYLKWPSGLEEGFDVRDFITRGATWNEFTELIQMYVSDEEQNDKNESMAVNSIVPRITDEASSRVRPTFDQVVEVFRSHLHMTVDMEMALKIIFATVLSQQIQGDPLWVHIVSPPGTAKTELLMPLTTSPSCYFSSTLTAHSLVSGFITPGGNDPSLLPKLNGKTFILKDFTEILNMPRVQKDEIYATLRGAYDGSVQKPYGNGLIRDYKVHFNMLSGVTHSVFAERSSSMGERFLIFHLVKGVGFHAGDAIRAAIRNVGKESKVRSDLQEIVRDFVEVKITPEDVPNMPDNIMDRIVGLSSIVAMLRANVEKVYSGGGQEKILYRPQHEMGTRLGKQLTKLIYGLSMVNNPPSLGEEEYKIVVRVALDTCVGFNLEAINLLVCEGGKSVEELCDKLELPMSTLRDQLDDMTMLGAIRREKLLNPHGRGAPRYIYHASETIDAYWKQAQLVAHPEVKALSEKREVLRSVKRVKKRMAKS